MAKKPTRWLNQPLSDHQEQLLKHYIAGWSADALATKFNVEPSTIKSTLLLITHKFNAPNRRTMIMLALYDQMFTLADLLPLTIAALNRPRKDDPINDLTD